MAEEGQRRVPEHVEEGEWRVRGGQAFEAGPGDPFARLGPTVDSGPALTVGSLLGQPQGSTDADADTVAAQAGAGQVVERLDYSNPFRQNLERVWFDGKIIYAAELGELDVDPSLVKVAQEYQIVYRVELDERGKPKSPPERGPSQYNI